MRGGLGSVADAGQEPLVTRLTMIWLLLTLALLPVKFAMLPHNVNLVDLWIALAMAPFWLAFLLGRQTIVSTPYLASMWLIVLGSLLSTFASPNATQSLIVLIKELFLFAWFVTITVLLSRLSWPNLRLFLLVWMLIELLHGVVIIGEFVSPAFWRAISEFGGQPVTAADYRPSGLFISSAAGDYNKAAFFQILGFVPLLLAGLSKRVTLAVGLVLFCSILATGSMGATVAFACGLVVGVTALAVFSNDLALLVRTVAQLVCGAAVLGSLLLFAIDKSQERHLESIIVGRVDKSAGSRFDLWSRGLGVAFARDKPLIAGIGPQNFREVDGRSNQLHNDMLAFFVERGPLGVFGLLTLAGFAFWRAISLVQISSTDGRNFGLTSIVFLATLVAVLVESLTHQIFHARELWLVLAVQEAFLYQARSSSMHATSSAELKAS